MGAWPCVQQNDEEMHSSDGNKYENDVKYLEGNSDARELIENRVA